MALAALRQDATATNGDAAYRSWGHTTTGNVSVAGVARKIVTIDSLSETTKTAPAAASRAGRISGIVTRQTDCHGVAPSPRAAASKSELTCSKCERVTKNATGKPSNP